MANTKQIIILVLCIFYSVCWQYCYNGVSGCATCSAVTTCQTCLTHTPAYIIR